MSVINKVSATLTTERSRAFNLAVGSNHDDPTSVASKYVSDKKL